MGLLYQFGMGKDLKLNPQTEIPLHLFTNSTYAVKDWTCINFKKQAVWLAHKHGRDFFTEVPGVTDLNNFTEEQFLKCFKIIDSEQGVLGGVIRHALPKSDNFSN